MSQSAACKAFDVPRCTLQNRLNSNTEMGARPGRPTKLQQEDEVKQLDFATQNLHVRQYVVYFPEGISTNCRHSAGTC